MKSGATYAPATNPLPVLSIDLDAGTIRRYTRVLIAGVGVRYIEQQKWILVCEGKKAWDKHDAVWDRGQLETIRGEGEL
jgi:hypothetical protein